MSKWRYLIGRPFKWLELLPIFAYNGSTMFSMELKELIPQVITSWQVWVTILVLVLFMYLVGYVARTYHRPRVSKAKAKKKKDDKTAPAPAKEEAEEST